MIGDFVAVVTALAGPILFGACLISLALLLDYFWTEDL